MLREKPLEIPEIVVQVVSYLGRDDHTKCVRVSKRWRDMFLPHIWREVSVFEDYRNSPSPQDLYPHRHLVQNLSLNDGELFELGTFIYPNLRSLEICDYQEFGCPVETVSVDLTKTCPSLTHLRIVGYIVATTTWMTLSALPHIKSLDLSGIHIEAIAAPWFWKVCERLEDLRMRESSIEGTIPEDLMFKRLRELFMSCNSGMDEEVQMDLVYRSTMLESLEWDHNAYGEGETGRLIRHPILNNHWPNLHKLQIILNIQDAELACFLRGAGNGQGIITEFESSFSELGTQASKDLSLHFNTLVSVDISQCKTSTRSTVPDILCSCPNLKDLRVGSVFAKDIAECGPWVCQQLRSLMICFRVGNSGQCLQLHQMIFERLSTLIQLKSLTLCIPDLDDVVEGILEFRLEYGLGQLASLQELSTIEFSRGHYQDYEPQLGMEEVAWMAGNWKQLEAIGGCLHSDERMESQLATRIQSLGIRYGKMHAY
ncbi:MAG: hypothetical protein J3Q66DRAFT_334924 [Benniella sp.]|nr:MAG: hypothetical protein J3Q66DRAFT_334924 [Benniella sp.]